MACEHCGGYLSRVPRNTAERLRWSAAFECDECRRRTGSPHWYMHYFSRHSSCPRCGNSNLRRLSSRDRIDHLWRNPFSLVQGLVGAPLHWCAFCRLQFYDLRVLLREPRESRNRTTLENQPGEAD